jgi:ElaA protein
VAVARGARWQGLAGRLMAAALAEVGDRECVLDAQRHLTGFYRRRGFTPTGPEYLDDGIPHVPMRR